MSAVLQALPQVIEVEGGYFSVTDYGPDLWVSNIVSYKRGDGNKVLSSMIEYARSRNKYIYGVVNQMSSGMKNERLKEWYLKRGAEIVQDNIMRI